MNTFYQAPLIQVLETVPERNILSGDVSSSNESYTVEEVIPF